MKIDHLDLSQEDGDRYLPLFPLHDKEWKFYAILDAKIVKIPIFDISQGIYFSHKLLKNDDIYFNFFNLMCKHINFQDTQSAMMHIIKDIDNMSACSEQINIFAHCEIITDTSRCQHANMVLEAIFQNSRAIFENLAKINTHLMNKITWYDRNINKPSKMFNEDYTSKEDYINKDKIHELLAQYCYQYQKFFFFVMNIRNDIFHSKKHYEVKFFIDKKFYISLERCNTLEIWNSENIKSNNLGSLNTLIEYIIKNTINALEDYANTIFQIIQLPHDMVPSYQTFYRSVMNSTLIEIIKNDR